MRDRWGEKTKHGTPEKERKKKERKNSSLQRTVDTFIPANKLKTGFHRRGGRLVYKASRGRLKYREVSEPLIQYEEVLKKNAHTHALVYTLTHTWVKAVTALQSYRLQSVSTSCIHPWTLRKPDPRDLWLLYLSLFLPLSLSDLLLFLSFYSTKSSHHFSRNLTHAMGVRFISLLIFLLKKKGLNLWLYFVSVFICEASLPVLTHPLEIIHNARLQVAAN